MSQEIGNSHIWIPVGPVALDGELPTNYSARAVNLHDKFPLPSGEVLQDIWDNREEASTQTLSGPEIPYTIFNNGAEEETMFWYLGYNKSARISEGAREAVALAALNPTVRVVAIEELQDVPAYIKMAGLLKHIGPYANVHMSHVLDMEKNRVITPTILGGRSKGGRVSTIVASNPDMPPVSHVINADMPGAHLYPSKLWFGAQIAHFENQDKYKDPTLVGIDEATEAMLRDLDIPNAGPLSLKEAADHLVKDIWMVRGLGALGLAREFDDAMLAQTDAHFTNLHATGNLGMPIDDNNRMILGLMEKYGARITAYIGHTRHFTEGYVARFGSQVAQALEDNRRRS